MRRPLPAAVTVAEIVARLGGEVHGDATRRIDCLASLAAAQPSAITFLASARHATAALESRAGAIVVSPALADALAPSMVRVLTADPYLYYARLSQWFESLMHPPRTPGIDPTACIAASARIDEAARIGPHAVIEAGAQVAADCDIGAGCFIGEDTAIGEGSRLHPGVTVHHGCTIGRRAIIHSGTVIGADGFGFAPSAEGWVKIAQLGGVTVGDDVEIGANCAIDRGALEDTTIGDGCKIDNLVQVAHNVRIGDGTAIAGCVGIAGSAVIGRRCMIGGGAGILGHLEICDDVTISAMSLVSRSIRQPGFYTGVFPLVPNGDWERIAATLKRLPAMRTQLRHLQDETRDKDLP
jgi:UDP-3-O-[3-hydroxymyristoyl] glucosamine N-acyltransferase